MEISTEAEKFIKHDKLNPKHTGPYKVVKQTKNDISCVHLADPTIVKEYHVSEVALSTRTERRCGCRTVKGKI